MLKKSVCFFCICLLTTVYAVAQVTVNRGDYNFDQHSKTQSSKNKDHAFVIKYGIKTGLNMTFINNDMLFDSGFTLGAGFRVGGLLNMRWGQRTENSMPGTGVLGFQPELLYSNQRVETIHSCLKMNYISVPLLLRIYPTIGFSLELGPEFSYLFATAPFTMVVDRAKISVGNCKGLNIGLAAGFAYDFEIGFTLGARYTHGFTDMAKNLKWKNNNIQVTVGWLF